MQNERNNEEQKTNLLNGIKCKYIFDQVLSFLQKDKLVEFYKSPNRNFRRNFRKKVKQTNSFQDIFEMVYPIYADEMLIKRNKKMYLSLFEDIFETDLSILKNKLKTLNQTAIDQKFAYDRKNDEISSQMLLLWMKMLGVEQISFDILSLNEESFRNRDLQKDLPVKNADDLCKMIKKIVASKSQTRVDKIFDKINNGQAYDYKLQTFDFYANKSGKKFDECENREMVWLNLCAMLVGDITDRLNSYYNNSYNDNGKDDLYNDMWAGFREKELIHKLYPLEDDKIEISIASPSLYQKVRNDLISVCKKLKEIKSQIHSGRVVGASRAELKKMGEMADDLMFFWDMLNCQYETDIFHEINKFLKELYLPQTNNCPKLTPNLYGEYIFMMSMLTARNSDKKLGSKINNEQFAFAKKNAEIAISSTNGREKEFMLVHNKNYEWNFDKSKSDDGVSAILDRCVIKLRPLEDAEIIKPDKKNMYEIWKDEIKDKRKIYNKYFVSTELTVANVRKNQGEQHGEKNYIDELVAYVSDIINEFVNYELSESEMADYKILSDKIKSGQVDLNEDTDKDNDQNIINETKEQKNDNVGTGEEELENREQQEYKKESYVKEKSGQNSVRKISGQPLRNTVSVIDSHMNKKNKENHAHVKKETERQKNNNTGDFIIHRKDTGEREKSGTNKKIVSATTRLDSNLSQTQKSITPAAYSQRNFYNAEGQNSIIKIVNKTELASEKSADIINNIAGCSGFDEVLKLYNEKKSDITDLIKNVQINSLSTIAMFFWLLVHPWRWCKFFDIRNLARLKKIYNYEKAKNNSKKNGPQIVSLKEKIKDDKEKASNVEKPETEIRMNTHTKE